MIRICMLLLALVLSFLYGVGVGRYEVFPHELLVNIKRQLMHAGNGTTDEYGRVLSFTGKEKVDCPPQDDRMGVILAIGQSNSANALERTVQAGEVPDVINWLDGTCYQASSPLLGSTGIRGEFISLMSQKLVDAGVYSKVLVLGNGIDGSSVQEWAEGNRLNTLVSERLKLLLPHYSITEIVWQQGETDAKFGMLTEVYEMNFKSLLRTLRSQGITAPVFLGVSSLCHGVREKGNRTANALNRLIEQNGDIFLGADTDELVSPSMRFDGCHFGAEAQERVAESYAAAIGTLRTR